MLIGCTNKALSSHTIMDSANSRLNILESAYLLNAAILNIKRLEKKNCQVELLNHQYKEALVGGKNQFYQ